MKILDNKALQLRVDNPIPVLTSIPKSAELDDGSVVVHWGVKEVHQLKELNIKAPAPILRQYNWVGTHKPYAHQKKTSAFLTSNKRAFCFSEQGTGKTASAIWAADFLLTKKIVRRVLVVCPLSIMDAAWRNDLFKFAMHRTVDVAHGSKEKRERVINSGAEFIVINYEGVGISFDALAIGGFDLIIVDEATAYKTVTTKRWKALNNLIKNDTWLWMMTGTPAAQGPVDAFGLAKLVNPSGVPRTMSTFRDTVMKKVGPFRWVPKPHATEIVHRALQPAIRFTKEECLDLPEMVYVDRKVELTKQQREYYKKLKSDHVFTANGAEVAAVNAAVLMNKLLQVASAAVYTDEGDVLEFDISKRYGVLREVIQEATNKVIVFVTFKHTINIIHERLREDGISSEVISGAVSAGKRTDVFKRFQEDEDPKVLIVQPQSAAHGVTLTAADTIVWWSPVPSLETYEQANARIHRPGQANKCTVVKLSGSPVEQRVYDLLDDKIDAHTKITDLYGSILD